MGGDYDEIVKDLVDNGLKGKKDFWMVEDLEYLLWVDRSRDKYEIDVGVDWLKGEYSGGNVYVSYVQMD